MKKNKGFTLVEMLLVIMIVGILTVLIAIISTAQIKKARDAQRKSDLKQIASALEQYTVFNAGTYPVHTGEGDGGVSNGCYLDEIARCSVCTGWCQGNKDPGSDSINRLKSELSPYLKQFPNGPQSSDNNIWLNYTYTNSVREVGGAWTTPATAPTRYCLGTFLENTSDPQINNPLATKNGAWVLECDKFQWGCAANYYMCSKDPNT